MVKESDLAITGTTLTTSESFLSTTISIGFNLFIYADVSCLDIIQTNKHKKKTYAWPVGPIKNKQQ